MSSKHAKEPELDFAMKAVIIYEHAAAAAEAKWALESATRFPHMRVQWVIRPWRIDMLRFQSTAEEALLEASDAHLMIFAGNCAQMMPPWLQEWLEKWATQRQVPSANLALINRSNEGVLAPPSVSQLSQFAQRHGLGIIVHDGFAGEVGSAISPNRALAATRAAFFLTEKPLEAPLPPHAYRGWGLNE